MNVERSMRERMLAGETYNPLDPELAEMHLRAQRLLHTFNNTSSVGVGQQQAVMRKLLGALGEDCEIKPPFRCDYGCNIYAGERVFINYDCIILDCNEVKLGDCVLLGPKVQIYTATHPFASTERRDGWESALPIEIGNDVWIGGGAILCPGTSIGEGSTVGAGSVVTRDIPRGVFAAGNPCRVIRRIADERKAV